MSKKILLINDMVGYGKVALCAAMPILIHKGYELYNLPTVLISNTLNYGKYATLDTTEYMKKTVAVWEELGFTFDAISVGFIASDEQAKWLADFCRNQKEKGTVIFFDPIMGDNGKLYNSVTEDKVRSVRRIADTADYIVPNYTEACHLAGIEYKEDGVTREEIMELLGRLKSKAVTCPIIKSIPYKDGSRLTKCVGGYDAQTGEEFVLDYEEIPVKINGAGDTFIAIMMSHRLEGMPLKESVRKAVDGVGALIRKNMSFTDSYNGLPIEAALDVL